ncbi:MAG: ribonuclease D [Pseudomonadota bacterium]
MTDATSHAPANTGAARQTASPEVDWIRDNAALKAACEHWLALPAIGVDTEFVRTRTYYARLGLIQIGSAGRCWLIDPLPIDDWSPLAQVLGSRQTRKLIHSGSEDIEIFQRLSETPLAGFFDTQIAAALCGLGPSLSYQALVFELCGKEIEKDVTRSDWLARPLSPAQIRYAALDVAHLDSLYEQLSGKLASLGRTRWLEADCDQLTTRVGLDDVLKTQFQRFKQVWRLNGPQRSALAGLLRWREVTARDLDRPRSHILTDNDLLALVRDLPADRESMMALTLERSRSVGRRSKVLLDVLRTASGEQDHPPKQPEPLDRSARTLVSQLRAAIAEQAQTLGIAPEVLCGKRDLLHLLQVGEPTAKLSGWRFDLVRPLVAEHLPT